MTPTFDIDRIVREVLAELTAASASASVAPYREGEAPVEPRGTAKSFPAPTARQEPRSPENTRPAINTTAELILTSRLITLNEVDGRLARVRRLVVRPGTVITPAVKDEIRNRKIQVIYDIAADDNSTTPLKLVIIAARTKIDPAPLAAALRSERIEFALHSSKCVIAATDQLAAEVKQSGTLGVLLTPYEAEAICLANRLPGIRAISGKDVGQVAADAAAVGANVLVIHPKMNGAFDIRRMLDEFCRGGVRVCPAALQDRLK